MMKHSQSNFGMSVFNLQICESEVEINLVLGIVARSF